MAWTINLWLRNKSACDFTGGQLWVTKLVDAIGGILTNSGNTPNQPAFGQQPWAGGSISGGGGANFPLNLTVQGPGVGQVTHGVITADGQTIDVFTDVIGQNCLIPGIPTTGHTYDGHVDGGDGTTPPPGVNICTFHVTAGSLPPGLSMDSCGHITGTPILPGVYPVTISDGQCSSDFTIQVQTGY